MPTYTSPEIVRAEIWQAENCAAENGCALCHSRAQLLRAILSNAVKQSERENTPLRSIELPTYTAPE